jgi:hypothetical protein
VLAERVPAHDRRIGADRRSALNPCGAELVFAFDLGARIVDIGEDARRAAGYAVFERDALVAI